MKLNKKLVKSYSYAFGSPEGELVLEDLKDVSGADDFTETVDPVEIAYQAGKRDFYLYVQKMINAGKGE